MGERTVPGLGALMVAGVAGVMGMMSLLGKSTRSEFKRRIQSKGITDPREVWDECVDYHEKLREELVEAKAKIKSAEDLVRVAAGLESVRKMMEQHEPPAEVKNAIISHWWTELMKLFVPWGLVVPEEIDTNAKTKYFRLAGLLDPMRREAELRAIVFALKEHNKNLRADLDAFLGALDKEGDVQPGWLDMPGSKFITVRVRTDLVQNAMNRYNAERSPGKKDVEENAEDWFGQSKLKKTVDDLLESKKKLEESADSFAEEAKAEIEKEAAKLKDDDDEQA